MSKLKVLLVEDERLLALIVKRGLEKNGHVITDIIAFAEQVEDAIAKRRPDVVLMDITLKGAMTGIEATKIINELYDIPVIYISAHSDKETKEKADETSYLAYLEKPVDIPALLKKLEGISLFASSMSAK